MAPTDAIFADPAMIRAMQTVAEEIWRSPVMQRSWKDIQTAVIGATANQVSPLIDPATAARITQLAAPHLAQVQAVFYEVMAKRQIASGWWPDNFDLFSPARITGFHQHLPADQRRAIGVIAAAVALISALTHHRHRRSTEPPGRLLSARRHFTRGPNTRWTTLSHCRSAGLVRA